MRPYLITNHTLKVGDIVDVWLDGTVFNGQAKLIKHISNEHSFIDTEEVFFNKKENSLLELTKEQKQQNIRYLRLLEWCKSTTNKELRYLIDHIKSKLNHKQLDNVETVLRYISDKRFQYKRRVDEIKTLFTEYTDIELYRFIQQTYTKNWSPTMYRYEKWLVTYFAEQYCVKTKKVLHYTEHTTTVKVARIVCINPNEDAQDCDIVLHTTKSDGLSNYDIRLRKRTKRKAKSNKV